MTLHFHSYVSVKVGKTGNLVEIILKIFFPQMFLVAMEEDAQSKGLRVFKCIGTHASFSIANLWTGA